MDFYVVHLNNGDFEIHLYGEPYLKSLQQSDTLESPESIMKSTVNIPRYDYL